MRAVSRIAFAVFRESVRDRVPYNLVIFATKGGAPTDPDWYHNLLAHPDVTVEVGTEIVPVRARVAEGDERDRLWSLQKELMPGFAEYEAKTTRQIPVVVLERTGGRMRLWPGMLYRALGRLADMRLVVEIEPPEDAADLAAEIRHGLETAGVGAASFIVVATMGRFDEPAVSAALDTEAPYVALVASRKRAQTVRDHLRQTGCSEEDLERLKAPAGLDLGSVRHEEIAVAVLAEIVQLAQRDRTPDR